MYSVSSAPSFHVFLQRQGHVCVDGLEFDIRTRCRESSVTLPCVPFRVALTLSLECQFVGLCCSVFGKIDDAHDEEDEEDDDGDHNARNRSAGQLCINIIYGRHCWIPSSGCCECLWLMSL